MLRCIFWRGESEMIYAQFYHYDLSGNLAEACGDLQTGHLTLID